MNPVLVCLHGWGGSKESFTELRAAMDGSGVTILTPDLPGFGGEPEPNRPWSVGDYADWVSAWIDKQPLLSKPPNHQTTKPIHILLLGHSHGGRIALKLAWRQSVQPPNHQTTKLVNHLYLIASAGIRRPKHVRRVLGMTLAKGGKALLGLPGLRHFNTAAKSLLYKAFRVHDYERASPLMRETMVRVSKEDLRPLLGAITVPTDIFWGTADRMTPYADAQVMQQGIRNATLHTFPGGSHRIHRDNAAEIAAVIRGTLSA